MNEGTVTVSVSATVDGLKIGPLEGTSNFDVGTTDKAAGVVNLETFGVEPNGTEIPISGQIATLKELTVKNLSSSKTCHVGIRVSGTYLAIAILPPLRCWTVPSALGPNEWFGINESTGTCPLEFLGIPA